MTRHWIDDVIDVVVELVTRGLPLLAILALLWVLG